MLLYWIWLAELKNLSILQKNSLLERFGSAEALYRAKDTQLQEMEISRPVRRALQDKDLNPAQKILDSCADKDIGLLPVNDPQYPAKLRNIPDAPILLYYKGKLPDWEARPFAGIVGTRKATAYGLQVAHRMGGEIVACGGSVVSGCAEGVDGAAMQGALDMGCPVTGVLGSGVDIVYPVCNRRLFQRILREDGCLISEYPPGLKPTRWSFPARNRIISGISSGVLVIESPAHSGSLITARYALEQGRDVFAVPGNIDTPTCEGSNSLLQQGATAVMSGWDMMSTYESLYPDTVKKCTVLPRNYREQTIAKVAQKPEIPTANSEKGETARKKSIDNPPISTYSVLENNGLNLSQDENALLQQLTVQPVEPADLIDKLPFPAGKVLSLLTVLTVKGLVRKHPGGRVSRK